MYSSSSAHPPLWLQNLTRAAFFPIFLDQLLAWLAKDLDSVFRDIVGENCERATVGSAATHRGSASEIIVNCGPVVEIQPVQLFSSYHSATVGGLNLSMVAVLGQDVFDRIRCPAILLAWKTLIPCKRTRDGD